MTTLAIIEFIGGWWSELGLARQIFYGIGLVSGFAALIMGVFAIIGMEHSEAVDSIDISGAGHTGGGVFSTKPLVGFFLGFGWAGGMAIEAGLGMPGALLVAFASGTALMALIVVMIRTIYSLKSDGTARIEDAIGAIGTVYVSLPPAKGSGGQVVVNFRGRQETYAALNQADRPVPSGDKVKVLSVVDPHTVLVEPLA